MAKNDCRERDENYMGQKNHKCDHCENEYASKVNLKRHIEAAHMNVNFFCDFCSKEFKTSADLQEHEKREHSGVAVPCPKCNKKLDPVGSTVRYEMMKLCAGSV